MNKTKLNFFSMNLFVAIFVAIGTISSASAAGVVQRGRVSASTNSAPASRGAAARAPVVNNIAEPESTPDTEPEPIILADKSSQFTVKTADVKDNAMADAIARQRAALDAQEATTSSATPTNNGGANKCDTDLRKCMTEKCGTDFINCKNDTTTIWNSKIESCHAKTSCSAAEYGTLAPEIKADRDMAVSMLMYNKILGCGSDYNTCITQQCGNTYSKCLGKSAMDAAVAACNKIATECKEYDSGLAARMGEFIAVLRDGAEVQIKNGELRLYELRNQMREQCNMLGERVTLDERTMNCVFSVEFYANDESGQKLFASKKAYAGNMFDCTPNWFGIDVTTFKENAYRLTRSQTAASSAMLGAGVGSAAGLVTSGALSRSIETQKANKEVRKAERQEKKAQKADAKAEKQAAKDAEKAEYESVLNGTKPVEANVTYTATGGGSDSKNSDKKSDVPSKAEEAKGIAKIKAAEEKAYEGKMGSTRSDAQKQADASSKYSASRMNAERDKMNSSMTGGGLMKRSESAGK